MVPQRVLSGSCLGSLESWFIDCLCPCGSFVTNGIPSDLG
ncbi:unnamed protein product [Acidithrix sp. C25]|nr:unnamed protein product [Acidithrix sp. C25]